MTKPNETEALADEIMQLWRGQLDKLKAEPLAILDLVKQWQAGLGPLVEAWHNQANANKPATPTQPNQPGPAAASDVEQRLAELERRLQLVEITLNLGGKPKAKSSKAAAKPRSAGKRKV